MVVVGPTLCTGVGMLILRDILFAVAEGTECLISLTAPLNFCREIIFDFGKSTCLFSSALVASKVGG